jgi:hypothetical protein
MMKNPFKRFISNSEGSFQVIQQADQLALEGRWCEAINLLQKENLRSPQYPLENKLVELRLDAYKNTEWPEPKTQWPKPTQPLSTKGGIPTISADEFNLETLRSGVLGHGALIVKGLVNLAEIEQIRSCIDHTLEARVAATQGEQQDETAAWFSHSKKIQGAPAQFDSKDKQKTTSGSCWVADSPRSMQILINIYERIGLRELLEKYFEEKATLSVKKWVMRKAAPLDMEAGWHQDGIFLGADTRTVNMWVSLSDCGEGTKAPGLDIVVNNERKIYEAGTHGADFDWTVGQGLVDDITKDSGVHRPTFEPGDAIFFDHFNLHRSGFGPDLSLPRYAVESWFFAASKAPKKQIPIFF